MKERAHLNIRSYEREKGQAFEIDICGTGRDYIEMMAQAADNFLRQTHGANYDFNEVFPFLAAIASELKFRRETNTETIVPGHVMEALKNEQSND